jgi:hypothetical protein
VAGQWSGLPPRSRPHRRPVQAVFGNRQRQQTERRTGSMNSLPPSLDAADRAQLAAQVLAVIEAHFHRPSLDETGDVLRMAQQQAEAKRHSCPWE